MYRTTFLMAIIGISLLSLMCNQTIEKQENKGEQTAAVDSAFIQKVLINYSEALDGCQQVLIVYNDTAESWRSKLTAMERIDDQWQYVYGIINAGVGKSGFAPPDEKKEGDGKSPSGAFDIGTLFTYLPVINTELNYIQSNDSDKWIDDPQSDDYNKWIRGETDAESFEVMKRDDVLYKYCVVIEYNTDSVIKGAGSAIFMHLGNKKPGPTHGCVSLTETNMLNLLAWLDKTKKPMIIMGNKTVLLNTP